MQEMLKFLPLIAILFFGCSDRAYDDIVVDDIPTGQTAFQKMLIAQLAGKRPIKMAGGDDVFISSRWDSAGKGLTVAYLQRIIKKLGLTPEVHEYQMPNADFGGIDFLIEPLSGRNVYTILPSTSGSSEYILLGAHYDTGGRGVPGAIDNGSGMALILSVLREAMTLDARGKNLMIVFFDQEEEGMSAGSIAFADLVNKKGLNIHSVHSADMIGWDGDNNKEVELELPSKEIESIYRKHAALLDIPIFATEISSSDHYSFIKAGINAVGISHAYAKGDNSGKKDTPEDKFHLVNFEYLDSSTRLVHEVVKEIIND
jgi:hypothetical protein